MAHRNRSKFVVDPSMFDAGESAPPSSLYADLDELVRTDLRYHYSGPICANYWMALCQSPQYGHKDLAQTFRQVLPEFERELARVISPNRALHLTSLGTGDGEIDSELLLHLRKRFEIASYHCLDSSFELLSHAVRRFRQMNLNNGLRIQATCCDFTKADRLVPERKSGVSSLLLLTGFTIGNQNELSLLERFRRKMNAGDLLLFDVRLHALHGWNGRRELTPKEKDSLIRGYDHETCHRFVFGPIEVATSAVASDVTFTYDVNRTITAVPGAVNVIIRCSPLETRMRLTGETIRTGVLNLAATTLYDFEQLLNWIPTTGLHPVWSKKVRNTGLFLLQKM